MAYQRMSEQDAQAEIAILVAASAAPALTSDETAYLLRYAKRADLHGLIPSSPAWTPTWDINAAAAKGWELKANKVVGSHDIDTGTLNARASQIYDHCMAQMRLYQSRIFGTATVDSRRKKEMLELPQGANEIPPELIPPYTSLVNE